MSKLTTQERQQRYYEKYLKTQANFYRDKYLKWRFTSFVVASAILGMLVAQIIIWLGVA